jgi:hypothetical protein
MGQNYKKLATTNAKFFGGGSLVNPDSPSQIVNQAKKFATGKGGFTTSKRKTKKNKSKK